MSQKWTIGHRSIDQNDKTKQDNASRLGAKLASAVAFTALISSLACPFTVAMAQEAADAAGANDEASVLDTITVTARRREETSQSVPIPITVESGESLEARNARDVSDLAQFTPNLLVATAANNSGAAVVNLRGVVQNNFTIAQDPKVGTYVDGVYIARPIGAIFDFLDVDRVEVLRGPQGTLFGRNTAAGLIHILSKEPVLNETSAEVSGGVGSDGYVEFGGIANFAVGSNLAVRIAANHRESDGYVENIVTGEDWSDINRDAVRVSALWEPSDNFNALLRVDYQNVDERPAGGDCTWTADPNVPSPTMPLAGAAFALGIFDDIVAACQSTSPFVTSDNPPLEASTSESLLGSLTVNWNLGFAELTSVSSYRDLSEINGTFAGGTNSATANYIEALGAGENDTSQWSQEFRLSGEALDGNLDWLAGLYFFEEDGGNSVFRVGLRGADLTPLGPLAVPLSATNNVLEWDGVNKSQAVFGEVVYRFSDAWSTTFGIRHTEDERELTFSKTFPDGSLVPFPFLACPPGITLVDGRSCTRSDDWSETTIRAIVDFQASEDVLLFGGYSEGYSSGGFNTADSMNRYEPEFSGNWELGLKSQWLDNSLQANVTTFLNQYENQQVLFVATINGLPTPLFLNAQESQIYGVEAEILYAPVPSLLLSASGGWLDGEYEEFTDSSTGTLVDLSGLDIILGPPYNYSFGAAYTHDLVTGGSLVAQMNWSERGRQFHTLTSDERTKQDAYGLLDGRLTWNLPNGKTTISLWGTNLLDEEYFSAALALDDDLGFNTKFYGPPRQAGIEFNHKF